MRKFFSIAILIVALLLSGVAVALQSEGVWQEVITKAVAHYSKGIAVKSIAIKDVRLNHQGDLHFENVNLKLRVNATTYFISLGSLNLKGLWQLLKGDVHLPLSINNVAVVSDTLNTSDLSFKAEVYFKRLTFEDVRGVLSIKILEYEKYMLKDFSAHTVIDPKHLQVDEIKAHFYGANIQGEARINNFSQINFKTDLNIEGLDLGQLSQAVPSLDSMKGIINGKIKVEGDLKNLSLLDGSFQAPAGGEIKAVLLTPLLAYIPQRKQVEELIAKNKNIPLNNAEIRIQSITDKKLSSKIKMLSSQLSLDMNVVVDVNIEGGLGSLWRHYQHLGG